MKDNNLAAIVGKNIYRLRKNAGMTQAHLSELVGITPAFLSRAERGEKMVSVKVLQLLTAIFDVSYDELLREESASTGVANVCMLLSARPEKYTRQVESFIHMLDSFDDK